MAGKIATQRQSDISSTLCHSGRLANECHSTFEGVAISENGTKIYELDPKKPADVFGHIGLRTGDWWLFQTCELNDGAHGSKMGYPWKNLEAFSVVV